MKSSRVQQRAERKDAHLKHFMECPGSGDNGFADVILQNNALPEVSLEEIDASCLFLGKKAGFPLMINAMTGGTPYAYEINQKLAMLAKAYGLPIAVGSQTVALEDPGAAESFRIVRELCEGGIVIANLGANSSLAHIEKAVEMIRADAVQLHLNTAQELCMPEGDRRFKGIAGNIRQAVEKVAVPVIIKEVGFGIAYETAQKLFNAGVRYIDTGGKGGTSFAAIEGCRNREKDCSFLQDWGIPTALSLLECVHVDRELRVICSGGIARSEEIVKALCMGAHMVGISGTILRALIEKGYDAAEGLLGRLIEESKLLMLLLGADSVEALHKVPYLLKGEVRELYQYKFA